MSLMPKSKRLEIITEVSRQVKEQERIDRALEEIKKEAEALFVQLSDEDLQQEADSLFQLSEEEVTTLSNEKILERLDEVLKREEELEEQIFQKELEREEASKHQLAGDDQQQPEAPDWLRNWRAMLGEDKDGESTSSSTSAVPIIHHTRFCLIRTPGVTGTKRARPVGSRTQRLLVQATPIHDLINLSNPT